MKIITISGAHSRVGKTKVAEMLLKRLRGWSALKVTVLHSGSCPIGRDCGVCNKVSSKFSIVSDKETIEEKGKDTQRFKKAGAKEVFWLRAKPEGLKQGLKEAISRFKGTRGLIIEGTSVLKYLNPDMAIFVKREHSIFPPTLRRGIPPNVLGERREKDSARAAFKKADLIITL